MNIPAANLSSIMEENEFEFINSAIKQRLNKDVKELKKLYQATVDGFKPETFHSKCDGIPNTLVLFKSEGNRRFGGFTPSQWTSSLHGQPFYDKNTFLFSLDKKCIYPFNDNGRAIYCKGECGPTFGGACDIYVKGKTFYTNEQERIMNSFDYFGDEFALSESGNARRRFLTELEVFEVIF